MKEITPINELDKITSSLPLPTIPEETFTKVSHTKDLEKASSIKSNLTKARTSFAELIKPIKQQFDAGKKLVLKHEQKYSDEISALEKIQDKEILNFKLTVSSIQSSVESDSKNILAKLNGQIAEIKTLILRIEKWDALLDKQIAESKQVPIAEKIDEIEQAKEKEKQIEEIQNTFVPEIVQEPSKVEFKKGVSKKLQTKTVYSISDKSVLIDYIKANREKHPELEEILTYDISLTKFNALPEDIKKTLPGVKGEIK